MIEESKRSITFTDKHYQDILDGQIPIFNEEESLFKLGSASSKLSKILFVDGLNGDDYLAKVGDFFAPFKTCQAAKLKATSGDTIVVFPGFYIDSDLLKNGVNWYFYDDTTIQSPAPYTPIFTDLTVGVCVCIIRGRGTFLNIGNSYNDTTGIIAHYDGTILDIEAKKIESMECWGQQTLNGAVLKLRNVEITSEVGIYGGGKAYFYNCFFNNSQNQFCHYQNNTTVYCKDCYFLNDEAYSCPTNFAGQAPNTMRPVNIYHNEGTTLSAGSNSKTWLDNCMFYSINENIVSWASPSNFNELRITNCLFYTTNSTAPNIRNDNGDLALLHSCQNPLRTDSALAIYIADSRMNKALMTPSYINNLASGIGLVLDSALVLPNY